MPAATPPPPKPASFSGFRLFGDVRPGEAGTVLLLGLNCFVALVAYYVLKVAREPLILNTGGADAKSYAAAAQALTLMLLVPLHARLLRRVEPARLVQRVVVVFLVCIELFYVGSLLEVRYLGFVFFVWVGIFSVAIVAQFWSFANDLYDTKTGERLFPVIALGAASGSFAGAVLSKRLLELDFGPRALLQFAASLLIVHILLYGVLLRRRHALLAARAADTAAVSREAPESEAVNGLSLILRSTYLRRIALLFVILNFVNSIGEFILGSAVTQEAKHAFELAVAAAPQLDRHAFLDRFVGGFYADFFTFVNVITIALQSFVASRLVARFGIGGVLFALPLVATGAYGLIASGAVLWAVSSAKIAENSTDYSLMNTARAMLWLPTSRNEKYAAKQTADTVFVRLGDVLAAGAIWLGTRGILKWFDVGPVSARGYALVNLALVGVWLWLANDLRRRYQTAAAPKA